MTKTVLKEFTGMSSSKNLRVLNDRKLERNGGNVR